MKIVGSFIKAETRIARPGVVAEDKKVAPKVRSFDSDSPLIRPPATTTVDWEALLKICIAAWPAGTEAHLSLLRYQCGARRLTCAR
jgi:hypothetical protein